MEGIIGRNEDDDKPLLMSKGTGYESMDQNIMVNLNSLRGSSENLILRESQSSLKKYSDMITDMDRHE